MPRNVFWALLKAIPLVLDLPLWCREPAAPLTVVSAIAGGLLAFGGGEGHGEGVGRAELVGGRVETGGGNHHRILNPWVGLGHPTQGCSSPWAG